jgi:hypothetical protein
VNSLSSQNRNARLFLGLLLLALPAWAQVKVGEDLSMNLSGTVGAGYNGDYGNTQLSDHSLGLNGDANLTGYYYTPGFVNFFVRPYYNRSQENSGSGSLTDATNVSAGAGIFSGSHFPGSVSFGKTFNSTDNFGLPGIQGFTTHGNSTQFGIGWSELVPGLPPVSAQYSQTASSSTVFGANQDEHSTARTFNLQSNYNLDAWMLTARFGILDTHTELPSFLTAGEFNVGDENSKKFTFNASHKLPLQGSFAFNYVHGSFGGDGNGVDTSGSNNDFSGTASFIPWRRLTTTFGLQYDTNLTALVEQQLISAGSVAPQANFGYNSHSLFFYNFDTLSIYKGLNASFNFNRIYQEVYGESIGVSHFSGILNFHMNKPLWGSFNIYGGVNDQSTDAGHQGTGLVAGVNFSKRLIGFDWGANFSYSQDVQTVLATTVTSSYSYLASAKRRFTRHLLWNSTFSGFHTGLGQLTGSSSHSESVATNLAYRTYNVGLTYSQSYGTALLTAGGLVLTPVPITPILSGNQYLLVNGSSYGISATANPIRRWSIGASYTKGISDTATPSLLSANSSKVFTSFTQVQFRKVSVGGGYTRLMQGISAANTLPVDFSSFFVGIQRWFNLF